MVRERVAPIDAHQPGHRAMHDVLVDPPLETVRDGECERDDEVFIPGRRGQLAGAIPDRRRADQRDQGDMHPAGIRPRDPGAELGAECLLTQADACGRHPGAPFPLA